MSVQEIKSIEEKAAMTLKENVDAVTQAIDPEEEFNKLTIETQVEVMRQLDRKTLDKVMPFVKPETVGALYGFEQDEKTGKWRYNITLGILGAIGGKVAGKLLSSKQMKDFITKEKS